MAKEVVVQEGVSDILRRVRKIEIKTRRLSSQLFAGEYASAFKGRGMAFSEVREYQPGDDVRTIDWNVTARFSHPYIKVFEEERELTVMLVIDVSASNLFGTQGQLKQELIAEIAAVVAFSSIQNNDKVGVIFFSDKIEKFIPPKKGRQHVLRIIRELIDFKAEHSRTDIEGAMKYFTNVIKKHCTAFIISDFDDPKSYKDALNIANKKHEVFALRILDVREKELPSVGLVQMQDPETGDLFLVDTSSKKVRQQIGLDWQNREKLLKEIFNRTGVAWENIVTGTDYVKPLMKLFKSK